MCTCIRRWMINLKDSKWQSSTAIHKSWKSSTHYLKLKGGCVVTNPPTVTTTSGEAILDNLAPEKKEVKLQALTPLQRAGLRVLLGLCIFSILALIPIMLVWMLHVPSTPNIAIDSSTNPQVITDTLKTFDTYKVASDIAAEQPL